MPKLRDKVYYCWIFQQYPAIRYLSRIPQAQIPKNLRDSYFLAMRILRHGPTADEWIFWKECRKMVEDLGLRSSIPIPVLKRDRRERDLEGVELISHAYFSPYPGKDNPCRRITFRK